MWELREDTPAKLAKQVASGLSWVLAESKGLFLHGPSGLGKTLVLSQLCRTFTCCGVRCFFINVGGLVYAPAAVDREKAMREMATAGHVVFDDMGCEAHDKAGGTQAFIYAMVDARYGRGLSFSASTMDVNSIEPQVLRRVLDCTKSLEVKA